MYWYLFNFYNYSKNRLFIVFQFAEFRRLLQTIRGELRTVNEIHGIRPQDIHENQGLAAEITQKFHIFEADESLVGDKCNVCLEDVKVGRKMMLLDCKGQHVFCQVCIEGWFAVHNTCPVCRHVFQ